MNETDLNMNANGESLQQPAENGDLCPGWVDWVDGDDGHEQPEFVPCRWELLHLVEYWETTFLDLALFMFDRDGNEDLMRAASYASRRVSHIIELLGSDAVEVVQRVRNEVAERMGPNRWNKFWSCCTPNTPGMP
jgi:hypothetical protein